MNLYVVYRLDRTDGKAAAIRQSTRLLHREYMAQFYGRVRLGGPILDSQGNGCGGMMVIEGENEEEIRAMVRNDPFELAELSACIDIYPFRWQTNRPADLPRL